LLAILFSPTLSVVAQKQGASIRGRILAPDGSPAFVTVQLKAARKMTITDNAGYFVFTNLTELQDTLIISSVDANTFSRAVNLARNEKTDIGDICLSFNIRQLQDVEVRGRVAQSYKSDYSFFGSKTETPVKDIPQSISTITKELIKDKMDLTLKDAVDQAAGVNQYSGFDEYSIRGFKAENARDINGLRGYNTTYTSTMLVNIERVEVIKGPTATLYGNCDPGGTINLVTKKPLNTPEAGIDIYGGSWSHFRAQADITGPFDKNKNLLYRFNAGYDNSGSFRNQQHSKSFQIAPSLTIIKNDKLQLNYDFSLSHMNTVLDWGQPALGNDNNLNSTPISLSVSQPGDYLKETDIASALTLSYKFNNRFSFNTGYLYYHTNQSVGNHGFNDYITPDSAYLYYTSWKYKTQTNTISSYFTYKTRTNGISHTLLLGYDFIESDVDLSQHYYELPSQFGTGSGIVGSFSLTRPSYFSRPVNEYQLSNFDADLTDVNSEAFRTQGIYAQELLSYKKWNALFSLRQEFYKGDADDSTGGLAENVFLPRIGLVYKLIPAVSLYASFNKGFDPFEASATAQVFDNAPFKPLISSLMEGGVKANLLQSKLSASLAVYQLTVDNVAVSANDPSNPNLYVQKGQDRSRGLELEAVGNVSPELSIYTSYAYCVAKVIRSTTSSEIGTIIDNAPRHESSSWIKYNIDKGKLAGLGIALGHSQVSSRFTLDSTIQLPGYIIFNGSIFYHTRHFGVAVNIYNLSNQIYWMGAYSNVTKWPGAPRNMLFNISYTL